MTTHSVADVAMTSDSGSSLLDEDCIIRQAISLSEQRAFKRGPALPTWADIRSYLRLTLAPLEHEVFGVLFLDSRHRVLAFEVLFQGTIDGAMVYPRQVVKRALLHNAAAVVVTHNHPSGVCEPSQADHAITAQLKAVLALIDVRLIDHLIIGQGEPFSFAEVGLL